MPDRGPWRLDQSIAFLNHGSYGACPAPVLAEQRRWRDRMEADPVRFLARELEACLDAARLELAAFLGADPDGLAFVPNATTGVSTVLASVEDRLRPGDELLATDHEYNATLNALRRLADRTGTTVRIAAIPFPIADRDTAVEAVVGAVGPRTRFALISHVTSATALALPIEAIVRELAARDVDVLVDGAHAPGMVPLSIDALAEAGAAWYTGNGHKWLCGPKGSGFLWASAARRASVHPLVTSHGANDPRTDRSRFRLEFDWTGTADPTAYLALPAAVRFLASLAPGGWPDVMAANRALALHGRDLLCDALGILPPAPDAMIGSMAAVPLPVPPGSAATLEADLLRDHRIEVPIGPWPASAALDEGGVARLELLRISAQRYNAEGEYRLLARALAEPIGAPSRAGWDSNPRPED